jgi:hypothetical protein
MLRVIPKVVLLVALLVTLVISAPSFAGENGCHLDKQFNQCLQTGNACVFCSPTLTSSCTCVLNLNPEIK